MGWENSAETHIWIFSVGRGSAAFVRTGLNNGFILDMACSDEFSPARFIADKFAKKLTKYVDAQIAQAVLSHPHRDHIQECDHLSDGKLLHPRLLTCPNDKLVTETVDWSRIRDDRQGWAELLTTYRRLFQKRQPPLQTILHEGNLHLSSALEYGLYYVRPSVCHELHPIDDNEYGNAMSIVFYLRYGVNTILFPGDVTPAAMQRILSDGRGVEKRFTVFERNFNAYHRNWHQQTSDQPSLGSVLAKHGLSVLVAPHHGLESCYSEQICDFIKGRKPQLVIISEKRHSRPQDGQIHRNYQGSASATGLPVRRGGQREMAYSLSTSNGHHILIRFNGTGAPQVYAEQNCEDLLALV